MTTILSTPTTITVASGTAGPGSGSSLASAAASLSAGQSANFSSGPPWLFGDSVTWQTATVYYDPNRKHVHAVGKVASPNPYEHYIYNEATNSWGSNTLGNSDFGHMWNTAFDSAEGAYYFAWGGGPEIYKYVYGTGWRTIASPPSTGGWSMLAGMGWHPNLYGTGDGGLVIVAGTATLAWRKLTNSWTAIQTGQQDAGYNGGSGAYDSVNNKLWVGTGNRIRAAIVSQGLSALTPSNPPLGIYGGGEGDGTNKVIPHPYTAGKLLLLASNSATVYHSVNSGATWSSAGYSHPFVTGNGQWTCGPISAYGIVWGLSSPGRGSMSKIWKPYP
jgi:hypothetical protein